MLQLHALLTRSVAHCVIVKASDWVSDCPFQVAVTVAVADPAQEEVRIGQLHE